MLKVKFLHERARAPERKEGDASGFDVYLTREVKSEGNVTWFGTDLAIEPPPGYYFLLYPRSSLSKTGWVMANSIGVIDKSYRGEIMAALMNVGGTAKSLDLPGRYVQLIPQQYLSDDITIQVTDELSSTERGAGGYGSTGVK